MDTPIEAAVRAWLKAKEKFDAIGEKMARVELEREGARLEVDEATKAVCGLAPPSGGGLRDGPLQLVTIDGRSFAVSSGGVIKELITTV